SQNPLPLSTSICLIKETFDKYAKGEGDESTLTKGELTQLIKKELLGDVSRTKLDQDGDGVVNYMEYVTFLTISTVHLQGRMILKSSLKSIICLFI
uniref:EF-hand domain-containing protein n=1 Tax=Cyclopterus lumpus TaxID=8103 RepID=A0A8C2ZEI2_CYCLU